MTRFACALAGVWFLAGADLRADDWPNWRGPDNNGVVLCVRTDGKPLWESPLARAVGPASKKDEGNEGAASPSTDGKHVYTFLWSGAVACHDFDGREVWKFDAQQRYGKFEILHGLHSTPLLHGDRLYLALLHANGHWVVALDKATGKEVWKVGRKTDAVSVSREAY